MALIPDKTTIKQLSVVRKLPISLIAFDYGNTLIFMHSVKAKAL